jgi:hypothetical protein
MHDPDKVLQPREQRKSRGHKPATTSVGFEPAVAERNANPETMARKKSDTKPKKYKEAKDKETKDKETKDKETTPKQAVGKETTVKVRRRRRREPLAAAPTQQKPEQQENNTVKEKADKKQGPPRPPPPRSLWIRLVVAALAANVKDLALSLVAVRASAVAERPVT